MRRVTAVLLGTALCGSGLVAANISPAHATRADARARQVAGTIPRPYLRPEGAVRVGNALFVLDANAIERIDLTTSAFTVFAGNRVSVGSTDAVGQAARFNAPHGITADATNLYVADSGNHTIRKVAITTARVTTIAGSPGQAGSADGNGSTARFNQPHGIAKGGGPNLWVTDRGNHTIRKVAVSAPNPVTTVAGAAGQSGSGDGTGAAARFSALAGIARDGATLWIADHDRLRKLVASTGVVTTRAIVPCFTVLLQLTAVAVAGGQVYVTAQCRDENEDEDYNSLFTIDPATGAVSDGPSIGSRGRVGLGFDGSHLYVTGYGAQFFPSVFDLDVASGTGHEVGDYFEHGDADGTGAAARFNAPGALVRSGGVLYVADWNNNPSGSIRRVEVGSGAVTTLVTGLVGLGGLALAGNALYVASWNTIKRVDIATRAVSTFATLGAAFNQVHGIVTDGTNLYAVAGDCAVYRIALATAAVSVVAGAPGSCGYADGTGGAARFGTSGCGAVCGPTDLAIDGDNLWVADHYSHRIRKVVIASRQVTTLADFNPQLERPLGIAWAKGDLYVTFLGSVKRVSIADGSVSSVAGSLDQPLTYAGSRASSTVAVEPQRLAADANGKRLFFTHRSGVAVIEDAPELAVGNSTVVEGDAGTGSAVFTVRLSRPVTTAVSVSYATADGTATTASGDYAAQAGNLIVPAGATEGRIKVTVNGDAQSESDETFKVNLSAPTAGVTLTRPAGNGIVLDDDPAARADLAIGDPALVEGDEGSSLLVFPVRLSGAQPGAVTVRFVTANGSATAGSDYEARSGTLSFAPGVTSATIWVRTDGDALVEPTERLTVWLTNPTGGATVARAVGTGRILNDD